MEQLAGITSQDCATPTRPVADLGRPTARPAGGRAVATLVRPRCDDPTCGTCYQRPETD
ncbi:hypothetical protein [Micromonospora sp. Llam0]|uniref:hypothetical protein n=1 Tax=Micromonospora sp. Llam0 TaxID=2485143 RepID=UPI001315683C|nr:hypothetical protein [Micromonospora sp. Llam0]